MKIECPFCHKYLETVKDYCGADILIKCPHCDQWLIIEVKVKVVEKTSYTYTKEKLT